MDIPTPPIVKSNIPPNNEEHFEQYQNDINKTRLNFIEKLNEEDKKNFLMVEKIVAKLDKSNPPFCLFIQPVKAETRGFWRYQKFTGSLNPFSEERRAAYLNWLWKLVASLLGFLIDHKNYNHLRINVWDTQNDVTWAYFDKDGPHYNPELFKPKNSGPEDDWKKKE